jgi:hypothetical protein
MSAYHFVGLRLSPGVRQTVKRLLPFNVKSFRSMQQWFYSDPAGEAEVGNAGEQPAEE